jgi:hypothetical protein
MEGVVEGTVASIPSEVLDEAGEDRGANARFLGWSTKQFKSDVMQIEVGLLEQKPFRHFLVVRVMKVPLALCPVR